MLYISRLGLVLCISLLISCVHHIPELFQEPAKVEHTQSIFPIFAYMDEEIYYQGSGFVIDSDLRYIITNRHMIDPLEEPDCENKKCTIGIRHNGTFYPVHVLWKHGAADLAIVKLDEHENLPTLVALSLSSDLLMLDENLTNIGYRSYSTPPKSLHCFYVEDYDHLCQIVQPFTVAGIDIPTYELSMTRALIQMWNYLAQKEENLETNFSDVAFSRYVVAQSGPVSFEWRKRGGMSGSPLFNEKGEVVCVRHTRYGNFIVCSPTDEIPAEYLPTQN